MKVPTQSEVLRDEARQNALREAYILSLQCKDLEELQEKLRILIRSK